MPSPSRGAVLALSHPRAKNPRLAFAEIPGVTESLERQQPVRSAAQSKAFPGSIPFLSPLTPNPSPSGKEGIIIDFYPLC
jgi:hypothetical protein